MEDREGVETAPEDTARPLYGIEGPRRRPRRPAIDDGPGIQIPEAEPLDPPPTEARVPVAPSTDLRQRWRAESMDRAQEADRAAVIDQRFALLRRELVVEIGRQVDAAVGRMQTTFEQEIEALRNANREEAKRMRSANGEALVRVRAADTQELERIRASIDEGIERLCTMLEGQLDRVWVASDAELERMRSTGADRLAEVHDLLMQDLARVRSEQPLRRPRRRWFGRAG